MSNMGTLLTSTPITCRISSTWHEDYVMNVKRSSLVKVMEVELKSTMFRVKNLDQVVFPSKKLPFTITKKLLDAISYIVPQSHTEAGMAAWLNGVADELANPMKVPACRILAWRIPLHLDLIFGANYQVWENNRGNSGNSRCQVWTYKMLEGTSASAYVLCPFQTLVTRFWNEEDGGSEIRVLEWGIRVVLRVEL